MALTERLKSGPPVPPAACGISRALTLLDGKEATALQDMLASEDWSAPAISSALHDEGLDLSIRVVQLHRRGECSCR